MSNDSKLVWFTLGFATAVLIASIAVLVLRLTAR